MILLESDIRELKLAAKIAILAGLERMVIFNSTVSGIQAGHEVSIFTPRNFNFGPDLEIGIANVAEFEKRLSLVDSENTLVEATIIEKNNKQKISKFLFTNKKTKIEYRCADASVIQHPTSNRDTMIGFISLGKDEIAILTKSLKIMGSDQAAIQIKKDGTVKFESKSKSNELFEMALERIAILDDEDFSMVQYFNVSSTGVLLSLLSYAAQQDKDIIEIGIMESSRLNVQIMGYNILISPKMNLGA